MRKRRLNRELSIPGILTMLAFSAVVIVGTMIAYGAIISTIFYIADLSEAMYVKYPAFSSTVVLAALVYSFLMLIRLLWRKRSED